MIKQGKLCCILSEYHTCELCGITECYKCWFNTGNDKNHYSDGLRVVCVTSGKTGDLESLAEGEGPYRIVPKK